MKTFVIGDIHGHLKELQQCLELSGFNPATDRLIALGDVCDRGPNVLECIQLLNSLPNLVYVLGNHDDWTLKYLSGDYNENCVGDLMELGHWQQQGGDATMRSITDAHKPMALEFFKRAVVYHEEGRNLFVHGGIRYNTEAEQNTKQYMLWDRSLIQKARYEHMSRDPVATEYDEVFVGHTPTLFLSSQDIPVHYSNVWDLDTGVCYGGRLTIMDLATKEWWQSDVAEAQ